MLVSAHAWYFFVWIKIILMPSFYSFTTYWAYSWSTSLVQWNAFKEYKQIHVKQIKNSNIWNSNMDKFLISYVYFTFIGVNNQELFMQIFYLVWAIVYVLLFRLF